MKPALPSSITRRGFLKHTGATVAFPLLHQAGASDSLVPHQATGTRVGEVTDSTAVVWTRLTREAERNNKGVTFPKRAKEKSAITIPVEQVEGACPGTPGRVRVLYGLREDLSDAVETKWAEVSADTDFIHQFKLTGLKPGSTYHYVSQANPVGGENAGNEFHGKFHTAPDPHARSNFRFCVMTCQGYQDRDHQDGHPIYPPMMALDPKFIAMTGDVVYYDNDQPRAVTPALARLHWERMFSLPRLVTAMRSTSTYWLKDDHDTLSNDCWPGMTDGELTFAEGMKIFREQAPVGEKDYRTIRWGRDLQVWFTEGRDFRSPNKIPDGPDKTIWGAEQKEWFKHTVKESDATWKVLISPTPIVGPDRKNKNDNHSNEGFAHEGNEIREWIKANVPDNFFVITGDRHWQYHSVHPTTGVQEFSVGAASDSHAGGSPGENKEYHKFHRVKGGFLSVELKSDTKESFITFQLRGVDGAVGYEAAFRRMIA
ncbi:MAG: alkaline phosphatase D family protein [Verrucomicrobiaceae bacterium]